MPKSLVRPSSHNYNRESVELALTLHFGEGGPRGWSRNDGAGYLVPTDIGIVELRTLREAALFVIACAEKGKRLAREASEGGDHRADFPAGARVVCKNRIGGVS